VVINTLLKITIGNNVIVGILGVLRQIFGHIAGPAATTSKKMCQILYFLQVQSGYMNYHFFCHFVAILHKK